ncbi:hypothetical protein [Pseudogemmobacter bohemicus]|uniref:hypothetical protein n=1 Tax=Pseudogemmobacter bohemicus TaxID=2250708 RepID=UPI0022B82358|nr:hypothetical protein [Pseudogemmobacter bohemicus]
MIGWLRKYHKVDSLRFVTLDAARKIITALKAWKARTARAACSQRQVIGERAGDLPALARFGVRLSTAPKSRRRGPPN